MIGLCVPEAPACLPGSNAQVPSTVYPSMRVALDLPASGDGSNVTRALPPPLPLGVATGVATTFLGAAGGPTNFVSFLNRSTMAL